MCVDFLKEKKLRFNVKNTSSSEKERPGKNVQKMFFRPRMLAPWLRSTPSPPSKVGTYRLALAGLLSCDFELLSELQLLEYSICTQPAIMTPTTYGWLGLERTLIYISLLSLCSHHYYRIGSGRTQYTGKMVSTLVDPWNN